MTTPAATSPSIYQSSEAPPHEECHHKDWTLGCPRCFWEMEQIARGNIRAANDAMAAEFVSEGAILMTWYHMLTIKDMEDQLAAKESSSLDLGMRSLCANIAANLRQLQLAMVTVIQDPRRLASAITTAAALAAKMKQPPREQEPAKAPAPATPSTLVLTDVA